MDDGAGARAKKGEVLEKAERPGDSIGGLLGMLSGRTRGLADRCSDTADKTGDPGSWMFCASCCPSA